MQEKTIRVDNRLVMYSVVSVIAFIILGLLSTYAIEINQSSWLINVQFLLATIAITMPIIMFIEVTLDVFRPKYMADEQGLVDEIINSGVEVPYGAIFIANSIRVFGYIVFAAWVISALISRT